MDIIKSLNLNDNIKNVKSGSIVGAKNIMLDPTNSAITNEYGFDVAYTAPSGYEIKGCISCNEELCIFLYNSSNRDSKIQRLKDNGTIKDVTSNWKWEGGKVIGTFAYNYKGELILAVSEINTTSNVPLKVWNVDTNTNVSSSYNLEEEIPKFKSSYSLNETGNLVCGTYTFFIRFKLSEDNYTKWFQLTDDVIIINPEYKDKPVHRFLPASGNTPVYANTENFNNLTINNNGLSGKSIHLNINIENNNNITEFQVGYIIKRDSEVLGRLFGEYKIESINGISISNNKYIEEINIDDFLEEPHQFYNVQNLINYNNRLYISNYEEYKDDDYSAIIKNIKIVPKIKTVKNDDREFTCKLGVLLTYNGTENIDLNINSDDSVGNLNNTESHKFFSDLGVYDTMRNFISVTEQVLRFGIQDTYYKYYNHFYQTEDDFHRALGHFMLTQASVQIIDKNNTSNRIGLFYKYYDEVTLAKLNQYWQNYPYDFTNGENPLFTIEQSEDLELKIVEGTKKISLSNCYIDISFSAHDTIHDIWYDDWFWDISSDGVIPYNLPAVTSKDPTLKIQQQKIFTEIKNIGVLYNNNRTLIPGQVYNFFVHFIRKDMSVTKGYRLDNNYDNLTTNMFVNTGKSGVTFLPYIIGDKNYFLCPCFYNYAEDTDILIYPYVSLQTNYLTAKNLIGYFISYEELDITAMDVAIVEKNGINLIATNTDYIYDRDSIFGNIIYPMLMQQNNNGDNKTRDISSKEVYTLPYKEKHIKLESEQSLSEYLDNIAPNQLTLYLNPKCRFGLFSERDNIYNNKTKTLYQLTPFIFVQNGNTINYEDNRYFNLPGFYNYQKVITFDKEIIVSPVSTYTYDKNGNKISSYAIKVYNYKTYSRTPLNAYSIKQDYEQGAVTLSGNVYSNKVLSPAKLKDFLEINECYVSKPLKSYSNYSDKYINKFDKTIYRSDIISDESLINGFRHFSIENYKNIIENKGKIVNIVGIGLYLLVHTEYSLFIFSRNNQLTKDALLQIPDVFDIDYKEITPSTVGFGGLKNKEESIVTKYGYIWFDRISKSIFLFDGKELKTLSSDIHNVLYDIDDDQEVRFAEDFISNRLIITVYRRWITYRTQGRDGGGGNIYNTDYFTISYNFNTNTFISCHDYTFDNNYRTYNNSYLSIDYVKNKLYKFSKYSSTYRDLDLQNIDNVRAENSYDTIKNNDSLCSYVDIVFNDKYETPKALNSISYILYRYLDKHYNTDYKTQKHFNFDSLCSGFKLYISTDLTFSGLLNIAKDAEVNAINTTKPHYNNGIWDFNNFRENIVEPVSDQELKLIETITYYNPDTRKLEVKKINLAELKAAYNDGNGGYDKSDMRSLIVGKYFILRFIFERNSRDLNIKFETLDVNISKL